MIPLHRAAIQRRDLEAVLENLVSDRVGPGSLNRSLAGLLQKHLGGDWGLVFRDRLTAADFLWRILELQPGEAVLFSPLGSYTLAYAAKRAGLEVVFADVSEDYPVLDPEAVQHTVERLGSKVRVVVADYPWGLMPDLQALEKVGITLVEDLRWGLGGRREMREAGTFGKVALISLEEDTPVCAGGGEALILHGRDLAGAAKTLAKELPNEVFLSDLNAALATAQWEQRLVYQVRRRELFERMSHALRRPGARVFNQEPEAEPVLSYFAFWVEANVAEVLAFGRKKGVALALGFEEIAAQVLGIGFEDFPHARSFLRRCVLAPLYPSLTASEQKAVLGMLGSLP